MARKVLRIYFLILFLFEISFSFVFTTYVLFLLSRGMNVLQTNVINFCFMVAVLMLEIPTGSFADNLGRKPSFVISCFITSFGLFVYFLSVSFWGFVLAEIIIALGITFRSGAFQSWLVDSLKHYNFQGSLDKVFSVEQQIGNLARIIGGLSGAYIARENLSSSWLAAAIGIFLVGILAQILMKEKYFQRKNSGGLRKGLNGIKKTAINSMSYGIKNKIVFMIICFGLIQAFSVQALNMYWQPRFIPFLPDRSFLGWIYVAIWASIIVGNRVIGVLLKLTKGEKLGLFISQLFTAVSIFFAAVFNPFSLILPFFLIHEFGRGMFLPIKLSFLNKNIPSEQRATVISFDSMLTGLGAAAGLLISGIVAKTISIPFSWLFSGIFLVVGTLLIYFQREKRYQNGSLK